MNVIGLEGERETEARRFKLILAGLLICLIVVSGFYVNLSMRYGELEGRVDALLSEYEALSESYDEFAGLGGLIDLSIEQPYTRFARGFPMVSGFSLEYWHDWAHESPIRVWRRFFIVFYAPMDGLKLRMDLYLISSEEGALFPLTLQKGNAFRNESGVFVEESIDFDGNRETVWQSPVIWALNATGNEGYEATLPSEGWYTLCMTGPIRKSSSGGTTLMGFVKGRLVNDTWQRIEGVHAWVDFTILRDGEPVLFIIDTSENDF